MKGAVRGKSSDEDYIDYLMSKEFGLDWQKYEFGRMAKFRWIMQYESEYREELQNKNSKKQKQGRFRPRIQ